MKKTVAAVVILLLAALGGLGYVLFGMEEDPFGPEAVAVNQPQLGVKSQPKTDADVLEALDYEISQNRDTIGWLKIPGTKINNSVLQSYDNAYYLRQDERRKYSLYGCYFADYECSFGTRDDLSPTTIIYGHSDLTNNPDGPRFSELFRFTEEDFARSTPVITFATQEDWMDWEVFAVAEYSTDPRLIQPEPEGGIAALAADVRKESVFDYDVQVGDGDHILTLITCTDEPSVRLVVMARLLDSDAELPAAASIASSDETSQEV